MSALAQTFTDSFKSPSEAIEYLRDTVGREYTYSRLGQWRNGRRPVPAPVRAVMLNRTLHLLLAKHVNLDPSYRDDLREEIMDLAS